MNGKQSAIFRMMTLAVLMIASAAWALAQAPQDALKNGFENPPDSAKPRAWWHWLNGNVTKEGITADLEWMKRSGIAGMQMFDGNLGTPQFVDKRLVWMTPDWKDALRHAGAEADRLGLEMSMAASGGWSETAGPWVKPEEAMKKVVWSETIVEGGKTFSGVLAHPPTVNGKFQNMGPPPEGNFPPGPKLPGEKPTPPPPPPAKWPTSYRDIKVIAYRLPANEVRMSDTHPSVTTNTTGADASLLVDGDVSKPITLTLPKGDDEIRVQLEFPQPFRAQSFTLAAAAVAQFSGGAIPHGEVQCSGDGKSWLTLVSLPGPGQATGNFPVMTYSFPETSAKFYRLTLRPPAPNPAMIQILEEMGIHLPPGRSVRIAEIEFSGPRVNHWEGKAAFANATEFGGISTPAVPVGDAVPAAYVVDLTSKMQPDGTLEWNVPEGKWAILRLGYSLTGEINHPASPEATGLEVDKLSAEHVHNYVRTYLDMVSGALGPYFGKSFRYFLMDSWEAGVENWTDDMIAEFQKRRGYDPTPYLPVLTGRIVESSATSDKFLWDFRRTIADLLAENHYEVATKYFNEHGVGLYAEAMGTDAPTTGDGLLNKGMVDIPMGEFWTPRFGTLDGAEHDADLKETASAAHIYGKKFVAAESFTTMPGAPVWASPYYLKQVGDHALASGINRIVFHTSDQQPFVDGKHKPGMTLGPFGQHYTRNNTWADQAVAWNTYLARCSYLLQQGSFVGDIAYFYGEGAPATVPSWKRTTPAPPDGYDYDWINADVLLNRISVKDGRLVLPSGMSYAALVLPDYVNQLTLPMLRKIRDLVAAGAIVVAPKPKGSPSLADQEHAAEFRSIATEVWGTMDSMGETEHDYGKGKVYWGKPVAEVLAAAKTLPDFEYSRPEADSHLVWIHRRDGDADIYFVANQKRRAEDITASFRVDGREAELWYPDTGAVKPASYTIAEGRTKVPLHFDPLGSVFVVFRSKASSPSRTLPRPAEKELATLTGPWQVSFPPDLGAPPEIKLDKLISWTDSTEDGVKYFSGTATYSKDFQVSAAWLRSGTRLMLDLGDVEVIAQVSVNGKALDEILWKPPFRIDITRALKPGTNRIEIKVTNLWPNRVIGDQQPDAKQRYAWLDYRPYRAETPLLKSGLLGPVRILSASVTTH